MANLFGGVEPPHYVGPSGKAIATQSNVGGLGMFPGTPDYVTPAEPAPTPGPGPGPQPQPGNRDVPAIELMVKIPGLLDLRGSLLVPPWIKDCAPALLPLVLELLRERIEQARCASVPPPAHGESGHPGDPSGEPMYARSELEQDVWDRE